MSSISNSFKDNHSVPLDFKGVLNVPESHEWTPSSEHWVVEHSQTFESIPVIGLSDPNAMSLIRHACEKWGAFQVINHGVPTDLLKQVELQTALLFALPRCRKLCTLRAPGSITGYGLPPISKFFPKLFWAEGFHLMGSPVGHATQLWPHQPTQQTNFCNVMEEYQKEMKGLTERIAELMLELLGPAREEVQWFKPNTGCNEAQASIQLNSYPVCPDPDRAMGLAAHTDSSLVTVLYQWGSSATGLQVLGDGIRWVPVQPVTGALVVNVGDLMHILSNGQFKSAMHRAVVSRTHHRMSVAYFYGPPSDVKVSPLMGHHDEDDDDHAQPLYHAVTWKEHLDAKATLFNKALDFIKIKKGAN